MKHKVDESLTGLLVDITNLVHLEGNPRKGNVDAIVASYSEFGQMRPIVVRPNDDGTSTILAGNHQVMAAKRLGWTHIAAVPMDVDTSRAVAFALADNRTVELGYTDNGLASDMIATISDSYSELLDGLGWDEFEIAYYEEQRNPVIDSVSSASSTSGQGFVAPVIGAAAEAALEKIVSMVRDDDDGERKIIADSTVNHEDAAIRGSTTVAPGAAPKAVVQYTIVFEDTEQQRRWYDFVRWLKSSPAYDGVTVAEKLMSFIDAHSEV
jgi:hypothetical protein